MYLSILKINKSWYNRWQNNTSYRITFSDFFNKFFHIFLQCFTRNFRNIICTKKKNNIVIFTKWKGHILQLPTRAISYTSFIVIKFYLNTIIDRGDPTEYKSEAIVILNSKTVLLVTCFNTELVHLEDRRKDVQIVMTYKIANGNVVITKLEILKSSCNRSTDFVEWYKYLISAAKWRIF